MDQSKYIHIIPAERVIRVLELLLLWRGKPKQFRMDNGTELILQQLVEWSQEHHIELVHIQPGKPAQNAYTKRLNRIFCKDDLDAYLFDDLQEVRAITEHWLQEYNTIRPHEALQGLTPSVCNPSCLIFLLSSGTKIGRLTEALQGITPISIQS